MSVVIFPHPLTHKTQPLKHTHSRTGQRFKAGAVLFLEYVCRAEGVFAVILFFGFCHYAPKIKRHNARLICCFTIQIFKLNLCVFVLIFFLNFSPTVSTNRTGSQIMLEMSFSMFTPLPSAVLPAIFLSILHGNICHPSQPDLRLTIYYQPMHFCLEWLVESLLIALRLLRLYFCCLILNQLLCADVKKSRNFINCL